jgi:hypothetical protein
MPIKAELDYKWGQPIFLKNDPEQAEYRLHRIILEQKGLITLELFSPMAEIIEVSEIHTTKERDDVKAMGGKKENEDD